MAEPGERHGAWSSTGWGTQGLLFHSHPTDLTYWRDSEKGFTPERSAHLEKQELEKPEKEVGQDGSVGPSI